MTTRSGMGSPAVEAAVWGRRCVKSLLRRSGLAFRILPWLLVWFSFVKLPTTSSLGWEPETWESVLAVAAAHHWLWGENIVFTYGPLGFLITDYYWGAHFWTILLWSLAFSVLLTILFMRLLKRVAKPIRIVLYVALPLLTIPHCCDLGIDPICLFAITLIGVTCFSEENLSIPLLIASGFALGLLSLIKFTFCLYGIFALLTITTACLLRRRPKPAAFVAASSIGAFLTGWLLTGQHVLNLGRWFKYSREVVDGYASAMSFTPFDSDFVFGTLSLLCLAGLFCLLWREDHDGRTLIPRIILIGVGIFMAWKEGFVRPDEFHLPVFQLYAFLAAATMPALFGFPRKRSVLLYPVSVAAMIFALAPFTLRESKYVTAAKLCAGTRLSDTINAFFRPIEFKHRLEMNLEARRRNVLLPRIAARAGDAPVGVLNYDQDVAILNGFNYQPCPVFLGYSTYTPELQNLNERFFDSPGAPEYVLWRYGTIDHRFPTSDEGRVLLAILDAYIPVTKEKDFILWKRMSGPGPGYSFSNRVESAGRLDQWIPVPVQATWLKIELHETWYGTLRKFLCRMPAPALEIQLENGTTRTYRLVPGDAARGFVINPLLESDSDLVGSRPEGYQPKRVTAVRVVARKWCFAGSFRVSTEKIEGIPALRCEPEPTRVPITPARSPSTAS